jgi:hypothetical protein
MVAPVLAEVKPEALALFTQATQPLLALVMIVAVFPALDETEPEDSVPSVSVFPERANEKFGGTVAETTIVSSVIVASAN